MRKMIYTAGVTMMAVLAFGLAACGNGQSTGNASQAQTEAAKELPELSEVFDAVKDAYGEDYLPSMEIDQETLQAAYGIDESLYEEFKGEAPMMSAHVDTFLAIRGKEGKGEEIEGILEEYRNSQIENSFQYPMNMPKLEASQVVRHGDDVYFVMLGAYNNDETDEAALLTFYQDQTKIGVDMIDSYYED